MRKFLRDSTKAGSRLRKEVHALFEKMEKRLGCDASFAAIDRKVSAYHDKLTSKVRSVATWGDETDALIHSLLTGTRVVTVKNTERGVTVVQDTQDMIESACVREQIH